MSLVFKSKMQHRSVVLWVVACLFFGSASGCHLMKMASQPKRPAEFNCGEQFPPAVP
jgi:hypothetical protein